MPKRILFLLIVSVSVPSYANSIDIRTESFDVDPNWGIVGSGIKGNDFGYDDVNGRMGG